eukprot:TRINITY_DN2271_c0_g1_i2.p1 TRINITY_DN2271_c0_g1~~TRINITY_DN2271_c0_g1_i2.p1  ORF type:complete len:450 (-),score=86.11 TRINITY_DN2271_c0_g1_i2:130-1458(-)
MAINEVARFFTPIEMKSLGWQEARRGRVHWRPGTTFLLLLERSTTNVAHFLGKVNQILVFNNATPPHSFASRVHHFMLPRAIDTMIRIRGVGSESYHAMLLQQLLISAFTPLFGKGVLTSREFSRSRLIGDKPAGYGRITFESLWEDATDDHPLCFQRVILPSTLKGMAYPGGPEAAKIFNDQFEAAMWEGTNLKQAALRRGGHVQLLYILRTGALTGWRRVFLEESNEALLELLHRKTEVDVKLVEFTGQSFKEQYTIVRQADIIITLHGAGLTNPCAYACESSVIIEIMPTRIFHELYRYMSTTSGIVYMMHQMRMGARQPKDALYDDVGVGDCTWKNRACKDYFIHKRPIELTPDDLNEISKMLDVAIALNRGLRSITGTTSNNSEAGAAVSELAEYVRGLCVATEVDFRCRQDLLQVPAIDPSLTCILKRDCPYGPHR